MNGELRIIQSVRSQTIKLSFFCSISFTVDLPIKSSRKYRFPIKSSIHFLLNEMRSNKLIATVSDKTPKIERRIANET